MRALASSALVLVLAACPSSQTSGSFPDPRFGVLVFETNDRPFSRAPPTTANEHVVENRGRVAMTADGSALVLIGLDSGRPFGTANDLTPSRVVLKKVSPAGAVSDLPSPQLGSGGALKNTAFQVAGDGSSPVIVDLHGAQNPGGRYVTVSALSGTTWKTVSFLRSDRAEADVTGTWNPFDDQVRVLRPGVVVVQHGNTLVRHDGTSWSTVTLPATAKELRLGTADATRVRAYWLTTDGALETDVLRDDGSWVGTVARVRRGTSPSLVGAWGFAGDLDTFTVHYRAGNDVMVMRHESGQFRLAMTRPLLGDELVGKAYLVATKHPSRSAFLQNGALTASVAGRDSGALGTVIGYLEGAPVTCDGDVTVGEGKVIAKDGARCVPRALHALDYRLTDDVMTLVQLFADERQDATLRFYVKRIPLPSNNTLVTVDAPALGGFPGDLGEVVVPPDQLVISGHVLVPGATDHAGTPCALYRAPTQLLVEAVMSDTDGSVRFSPVDRGTYEVQCNRMGFSTLLVKYSAADLGTVPLDAVLLSTSVPPDDLPLLGDFDFGLDGGTLTKRDGTGVVTTLSSSLAAGDSVRRLGPGVMWKDVGGSFRTSLTSTTVFAAPREFSSFRYLAYQPVAAVGVPDGQTALNWVTSNGTTPLLSVPAVEVSQFGLSGSCGSTVVWTLAGPGDVRAQRAGCSPPLQLVPASLSTGPIPVMKTLETGAGVAFGFVGEGCGEEGGYLTACPAHTLSVNGGGPLTSVALSANALEVRALGTRLWVLERTAPGVGTLRASPFNSPAVDIVVQAGIPLPASWLPGEQLVVAAGNDQRVLVRADTEVFSSLGTAGSWTRLAGNVRALFPGGYVLQLDGTLLRVAPGGALETLPLKGNGNLRFSANGLISDAAEMTCPDGSTCRVVQRMLVDKSVTSLGVGRLVPDVTLEPRKFGAPAPREFKAQFEWPAHRARLNP